MLDQKFSAPVENFINQIIYIKKILPFITRPTRVTPNSSSFLIDNICCNTDQEVVSSGVIITNISDHLTVFSREKLPTQLKIQWQSTIECFRMRTYQTLKIHYKLLTGTRY